MRIGWIITGLMALAIGSLQADTVQVREAAIRDRPSFLGRVVGSAAYGDLLTPTATRGPWIMVNRGGRPAGWVHTSALTRPERVLRSGDEVVDSSVSSDELALAGKGFSAEVEAEFRGRVGDAGFRQLDRMERSAVSASQRRAFLRAGGLTPQTGAQP